jgi:alpha-tubulin suppressor-like RCC1 family protein
MDRSPVAWMSLCLLAGCSAPSTGGGVAMAPADPRFDPPAIVEGPLAQPGKVGQPTVAPSAVPYRALSLGGHHGCGVRDDDSLWCWGDNHEGQIGDGTRERRYLPAQVAGSWRTVSAGAFHSCAIAKTGAISCWGSNAEGPVGGSDTGIADAPVALGAINDWKQVSAGEHHSCALRENGELHCWGANTYGEIGDGTTDPIAFAPRMVGTGFGMVSAGGTHTCAIKQGALFCWGNNEAWQLGDGSADAHDQPKQIGGKQWLQVSAGHDSTCAVRDDHTLWCWGGGVSADPAQIDAATDFASVDLYGKHACALRSGGEVLCWGDNAWGQLGDGTSTARSAPAPVVGASGFAHLAVGRDATCAIKSGQLWCWGQNREGQLAIGEPRKYEPVQVSSGSFSAVYTSAGGTCARGSSGALSCWGKNTSGQLGVGNLGPESEPRTVGAAYDWTAVAGGDEHRCGVRAQQSVWCWGAGDYQQLAFYSEEPRLEPGALSMTGPFKDVVAAANYACALRSDGNVLCWGEASAEVPVGDLAASTKMVPNESGQQAWQVPGLYAAISAGKRHTCGLRTDGSVWCWGDNDRGQRGPKSEDADNEWSWLNQAVSGNDFVAVSAGGEHSCALRSDGTLLCWGANNKGQLADGLGDEQGEPVEVDGTFVSVSAGRAHTCAITHGGALYCWGDDSDGQIGDGRANTAAKMTPVRVGAHDGWRSVSAGPSHTCGVHNDGSLWCWGRNSDGELGDGTAFRKRPAAARQ